MQTHTADTKGPPKACRTQRNTCKQKRTIQQEMTRITRSLARHPQNQSRSSLTEKIVARSSHTLTATADTKGHPKGSKNTAQYMQKISSIKQEATRITRSLATHPQNRSRSIAVAHWRDCGEKFSHANRHGRRQHPRTQQIMRKNRRLTIT